MGMIRNAAVEGGYEPDIVTLQYSRGVKEGFVGGG